MAGADLAFQVCDELVVAGAMSWSLDSGQGIDGEGRGIFQVVGSPTGPWPVPRRFHQAALDRIVVHVGELLEKFFLAIDSKGIESALPDAAMRAVVNGVGQVQALQHAPAPGVPGVGTQDFGNPGGRAVLELLDDPTGQSIRLALQKKVEVVGHEHPAVKAESKLVA